MNDSAALRLLASRAAAAGLRCRFCCPRGPGHWRPGLGCEFLPDCLLELAALRAFADGKPPPTIPAEPEPAPSKER